MNQLSNALQTKKWLNEVSFIRPILILLLIHFHAFAPYIGSWHMPDGITSEIPSYIVLCRLFQSFQLEGFIFISGYIFTFQILDRKKFNSFGVLVKNKFSRLIIPCIIFGTVYFLCFRSYESFWKASLEIFGGIGHLWYLPCLFWCFLAQYWLLQKSFGTKKLISVFFALSLIAFPFPSLIGKLLYYMLFFYGGGIFFIFSKQIAMLTNLRNNLVGWLVFLLCFSLKLFTLYGMGDFSSATIVERGGVAFILQFVKILTAWAGIMAIYQTAVLFCRKHKLKPFIMTLGTCGYGIYVFHQFILLWLYFHTSMSLQMGSYLLPWVAALITLILSFLMTYLVRMTVVGRKYL